MANDATNKAVSNSDPTETTSLSAISGDQQKVPPLRIVLNTASNQKTSSTTKVNQPASTKKERAQDARAESTVKVGGRVRIKLGTNKQQQIGKSAETTTEPSKRGTESSGSKVKDRGNSGPNEKQEENIDEESTTSFNHLRRITRRSQRTIQSITNEDEESISSMTSVDENLNTNTTQTNSDITQDPEQSNPASSTSGASAPNNATNGSSNTDTPRRYKRRRVEASESQSLECDSLLGSQNYKLPHQNSFELFKNIRKQVDKKLKNLNSVQPKTPFGLRDFMLTRGAYLLDGNKLGNGTSLFMNEDGGLNTAPLGKYHVIRSNKTNYSVPNKARVPSDLPVNSPLHDLFIEQEKERYRMRIQHIKEREKLTLAAEQEFVRAYGQAALAAANQDEPFSVCTLLKHQEIYNYLDTDGSTILSREDAQQDQVRQPDGVRTRRRQHGQISPGPVRKPSCTDEPTESAKKEAEISNTTTDNKKSDSTSSESADKEANDKPGSERAKSEDSKQEEQTENSKSPKAEASTTDDASTKLDADCEQTTPSTACKEDDKSNAVPKKIEESETDDSHPVKTEVATGSPSNEEQGKTQKAPISAEISGTTVNKSDQCDEDDRSGNPATSGAGKAENPSSNVEEQSEPRSQPMSVDSGPVISDEERRSMNKDSFLAQLQEIDDKWDRIRREMLVRHKNEAESLHAIQKLEWEWKTKETGACDVRTTLIIDNTFVPKLDVSTQDY